MYAYLGGHRPLISYTPTFGLSDEHIPQRLDKQSTSMYLCWHVENEGRNGAAG